MANKTFSFELQQFDCRLPSVEAAAWGQEQGAARLVSKRSSQEYRVTYRIERLRDERGSSFTPKHCARRTLGLSVGGGQITAAGNLRNVC